MENTRTKKKTKKETEKTKKYSSINLLEDKRTIYLHNEITDECAKDIVEKLLKLDFINHKEITIIINSPGGSVSAGFAIYDTMNYIKSPVITICCGRAASMGAILLLNGSRRYCLPNSSVMLHEVSSGTFGKLTEMQEKVEHTRKTNDRLLGIIAEKTGKSLKQVKRDTINKDAWMYPEKALEYGIIDKIL